MKYREFVIVGPRGELEALLADHPDAIDAELDEVDCETLRERIKDHLHPSRRTEHVLVAEDDAGRMREDLGRKTRTGGLLTLVSERPLASGSFEFSYEAFSREHARRVRGLIDNLAPGACLAPDAQFEETESPEGRDLSLYAPLHAFESRGRGTIEGECAAVIALHRICRNEELIHLTRIRLQEETG